jgi:hypothetical protein
VPVHPIMRSPVRGSGEVLERPANPAWDVTRLTRSLARRMPVSDLTPSQSGDLSGCEVRVEFEATSWSAACQGTFWRGSASVQPGQRGPVFRTLAGSWTARVRALGCRLLVQYLAHSAHQAFWTSPVKPRLARKASHKSSGQASGSKFL